MADVFWTAQVYARLVGVRLRGQMQYRLSFLLLTLGSFLGTGADLIALVFLMQRIPQMEGWSLGELAFLYGAASLSFALAEMTFAGFDGLRRCRSSAATSIRCWCAPWERSCRRWPPTSSRTVLGGWRRAWRRCCWRCNSRPSRGPPLKVAYLPVMVLSGTAIFGALLVTGAALCFWTVRTAEITNIFTFGGVQLASYPLGIYAGWLRRLVIFIVPLAFINYFPALWILGKDDPLGMPGVFPFLSPLAAFGAFLGARAAWSAGVRHYQSTGS